jgi:hypothetical protein
MHYTKMAALHVSGAMPSLAVTGAAGVAAVSGATAVTFLIPVLVVIGLATFLLTLAISVSPSEDEIRAGAELRRRLDFPQQREG